MSRDQRKYPRTPIKLTVKLSFPDGKTFEVETWDISDGGIGITFPKHYDVIWTIGMALKAKVQGLPVEGPELPMNVVRISDDRIGLKMA